MLFVALSCLQGRPMQPAFDELAQLGVGIQLTPGNLPTPAFRAHVAASGLITRRHHGFAWDARKTAVWVGGECAVDSDSVHPPRTGEPWRRDGAAVVEVMYPGYELGTGDAVERALDDGLVLAVDISHVFLQREQGAMTERTWRRLAAYDQIAEVHVSANRGRADSHQPITRDTFGLDWARERVQEGEPVILECYMHKLSAAQRESQLEILR